MSPLHLTLYGVPRTKKNSGRIVPRGKRHIILPSEAWEAWNKAVSPVLRSMLASYGLSPIAHPVLNDKWIVTWDGSRLLKDAARPRVELVLEPIAIGA